MNRTLSAGPRSDGAAACVLLAALCLVGCTAGPASSAGGGSGGGDSGNTNETTDPQDGAPAEDEVRIIFLNESDVAVDTQFYFANEPLDDPGEDLFEPRFLVQAYVGVPGTGIVLAGDESELIRPCSGTTYLGTDGGEFLDPGGQVLATGQRRLLRVGESFDCGNTVIFAYTGAAGDYDSAPPVVDSRD